MNRATELGIRHFPWWPNWRGECVAIVGCGPSINGLDLSILHNRIHVIAIKEAIDLCPWAEVCYGCDAPWWIDRKGLPKYHGIKLFHGIQAANKWDGMHRIEIDISKDLMLLEQPLKVGNGGCSGFQALNLAMQFGATDVILVGFDLHERGGMHWYGRNKWPNASNPVQSNFNRWRKGFEVAKSSLSGITVINASPNSDLKCFPRKTLDEALADWGL